VVELVSWVSFHMQREIGRGGWIDVAVCVFFKYFRLIYHLTPTECLQVKYCMNGWEQAITGVEFSRKAATAGRHIHHAGNYG